MSGYPFGPGGRGISGPLELPKNIYAAKIATIKRTITASDIAKWGIVKHIFFKESHDIPCKHGIPC